VRIRVENQLSGEFDFLVVTRSSGSETVAAGLDEKTTELVNKVKSLGGAEKYLETETILYTDGGPAKRLVVVGTGKPADFEIAKARQLAATVARSLRKKGGKKLAFAFETADAASAGDFYQAFAEGVVHSTFEPGFYYTGENKDEKVLDEVVFLTNTNNEAALKDRVERGVVIGEGINLSRTLANETPNNMYPERLAQEAEKVAKEVGLEFHALDKAQLEQGGFKAILAVGQGSVHDPRMIVLKYNGAGDAPYTGIVGKGITFDSGGISLKPAEHMDHMKFDMCGGAWTVGIMRILAQLKAKVNVIGVVAAAENLPGGGAYRPGDVIGSLEGKSIEVLNTDAEGRLVLADGLAYARKLGATRLVDMATLTGAIVVALGNSVTGVFTSDQDWTDLFLKTARNAGERAWQMPLFPEYKEQIKGTTGDLLNTGGRAGGSCTAAAFLKEFTGGVPWIHLDIAGTAYTDSEKPYQAKGPSGQIMRTLIDFVVATAGETTH
jgi:leucyl aminopeptidase